MKSLSFPIAMLLAIILSSCPGHPDSKRETHRYLNDFEGLYGVFPQVIRGFSHSGRFFYQVNGQTEYTPGFTQFFADISNQSFAAVEAKVFLYLPEKDIEAFLQIQLWDEQGKMMAMASEPFHSRSLGLSQWKPVTLRMSLLGSFNPKRQIRVFIHNPYGKSFRMDDFQVRLLP